MFKEGPGLNFKLDLVNPSKILSILSKNQSLCCPKTGRCLIFAACPATILPMLVSVEVPDPIAHSLGLDGPHSGRRALEMFALEGYRSGELSSGQVGKLLGMPFDETEAFLKEHGAMLQYSVSDFDRDSANLREFLSR